MTASFAIDGSYRRHGRVVLGGSPLRLFRLSTAGRRVVEAIEAGAALPDGHAKLTDRLVDAGAIHPIPGDSPFTANDVTVVVPAYNAEPSANPTSEGNEGIVIVVDDGSEPPLPDPAGRRTIRLSVNSGPAAARNAGLAEVGTPLVAFVDTDVELDPHWLGALLPHFADPRVALVAPRVRSAAGTGPIAAYEVTRSPLDLGTAPARIAAGSRVSYVPAAAFVARADAVRSVGGFDESMRSGEDVDLVWRLLEAGHRCRYEPASTVEHRPRPDIAALARQRMAYGRSAATLDRKHPGEVAPLRMSGWSAVVWGLVLIRRPLAAATVAAGTIVALRRKLNDLPATESARLAGLGHVYAGRQVASALTRAWWPLTVLAALFARRLRPALLAAAIVPPVIDWWSTRDSLDLPSYVGLHIADDAAYGTGLWIGALQQWRLGALAPKFTNWPGRGAG